MIFADNLYWSEHAAERRDYILANLREGRFQIAAHLITEAKAPNLYEIYSAASLPDFPMGTDELRVLGIGYGYRDTLRLLCHMIEERYGR